MIERWGPGSQEPKSARRHADHLAELTGEVGLVGVPQHCRDLAERDPASTNQARCSLHAMVLPEFAGAAAVIPPELSREMDGMHTGCQRQSPQRCGAARIEKMVVGLAKPGWWIAGVHRDR